MVKSEPSPFRLAAVIRRVQPRRYRSANDSQLRTQQELLDRGTELLERGANVSAGGKSRGGDRVAARLFLRAYKLGSALGAMMAGYCFDVGRGVRRDEARALKLYKRGWALGSGEAAENASTVYRDRGDSLREKRWLHRARACGNDSADVILYEIYLHHGLERERQGAEAELRRIAASDDDNVNWDAEEALVRWKEVGVRRYIHGPHDE